MTIKTTHSQFESALAAARKSESLNEAQRYALTWPPATYVLDEGRALSDGYYGKSAFNYGEHMLEQHAERLARVERILAILDGKAALDAYEAPRLLSFVASLRHGVPRVLSKALRLLPDTYLVAAADALAAALRDLRAWRQNRPEPPTREILARDQGVA